MKISTKTEKNTFVVTLEEKSLDNTVACGFKDEVGDLFITQNTKRVVLNLSHLTFIDSSGLGSILSLSRMLKAQGGMMKIACKSRAILAVFELVSLDKIFEIHANTEDAIKSFHI